LFINNQFATTISLLISAALIPPLVYVGYRTILLQRKNRSYWNFDTINTKQSSNTSTISKKQIKANRHIRKGILLLDRGSNIEATKEFDKALELDPNDAYAHYQRGRALFEQGENDDAVTEFTSAVENDRNLINNVLFEAAKFHKNKKIELATEIVDKILEIHSTNPDAQEAKKKIQQNSQSPDSGSQESGKVS
jgi:tetratricopeptide (TPR) repeat protein